MDEIKQINYGIDLEKEIEDQQITDWEFGAFGEYKKCSTDGLDLKKYLPQGEVQRGKEDFMDCATRAPINDQETKFTALIKEKRMSVGNIQWLHDNGYTDENDNATFSDRFIAMLSGTSRNGNSLIAPWKAINKYGLIPKKMLPASKDMTWNQYHNKEDITQEMYNLGREFLKRFEINYERVRDYDFFKFNDGLDVAGWAWPEPVNGVYPRVEYGFNHAFYKLPNKPIIQIFDNYIDNVDDDFIKQLAPNYQLMHYGYRSIISEKEDNNVPVNYTDDMLKTIKFRTDPRIFIEAPNKHLYWVGGSDETAWNDYKLMLDEQMIKPFEEVDDAMFPQYNIQGGIVKLDYYPETTDSLFNAWFKKLVGLLKGK